MCVCVPSAYLVSAEARWGHQSPSDGSYRWLPCGCPQSNLGPLDKQPELPATDPSLQCLSSIFAHRGTTFPALVGTLFGISRNCQDVFQNGSLVIFLICQFPPEKNNKQTNNQKTPQDKMVRLAKQKLGGFYSCSSRRTVSSSETSHSGANLVSH